MDNSNRPDIRAYIGATGSGKGVSIREHLRKSKPSRLIVWDPLGEYGEFVTKTTAKLSELITAMQAPAFRVAYWPGNDPARFRDRFAAFCEAAFSAGNLTVLVEELADVTSPSWAPGWWRYCTTKGRHRGLKIIAASQRPAQVDKDFLGGCTYIRCFTLRYKPDRVAMASSMDVDLSDIAALTTVEAGAVTTINYLERDFRSGKTSNGSMKLTRKG